MDIEIKLTLISSLPYYAGLIVITLANIKKPRKPIVPHWLYIVAQSLFWLFFAVWLAGWQLNLFSQYLGVPDRISWNFFVVAVFIKSFMFNTKGKFVVDKTDIC